MKQIKFLFIIVIFAAMLAFGNPSVTGASANAGMPPAIVLVQDENNKMLVNHNFVYDTRIFVPGDTESDPEFYVNIPGRK